MRTGWWRFLGTLLLSSGFHSGLVGQPVLLRLEPPESASASLGGEPGEAGSPAVSLESRGSFEVNTFAGKREVTGYAIEPDSRVVALVLADSFLDEDWARVEAELVGLRKGLWPPSPTETRHRHRIGTPASRPVSNGRSVAACDSRGPAAGTGN